MRFERREIVVSDLSKMDPAARRFLAMVGLGAAQASGAIDIAARRTSFEGLMRFARAPTAAIDIKEDSIPVCGGVIAARTYVPLGAAPVGGLLYFHGGGLVAGGIDTHDSLCRMLSAQAETTIVSIGYRLAPEHPFPTALLDAVRAVRHVLRHPDRFYLADQPVGVGGDSGGATLAAIVARIFRRHIRLQLLLCPVLDFSRPYESRQRFGEGFLLDATTMQRDLAHYAPWRPLDDPWISPAQAANIVGLPPAIIHTAGFDPLRDEGAAYAERLGVAGVPVAYTCHDRLIHHFYGLASVIPSAQEAVSQIASDLRRGFVTATPHNGGPSRSGSRASCDRD